LRIFVSHSHQDDGFARDLATALRGAGADVWYDERHLVSGELGPEIERELRARLIFVPVLSPAALASRRVEEECRLADSRQRRDPTCTILPVVAAPLAGEAAIWPFLQDFKRVEAPGLQPYPPAEAIRRTLLLLALTSPGEAPAPVAPQPTESAADLVTRGKALQDQDRHAEALLLFERATQLDPNSFDAWFNLGYALTFTKGSATEQLAAYEQAIALSPNNATAWNNMGVTLAALKRDPEALSAFEQAIALDPTNAVPWASAAAWDNKGRALARLKRYAEAVGTFEQAIAVDPTDATIWDNKGVALIGLNRYEEALAALERATALDPTDARAWTSKAVALALLGRASEVDAALARAKALGT
jgi:tetratricopeptide (TPR) repeat protein